GLFSASTVEALVTRALAAPLQRLTASLRAGDPVEFVGVVQELVGAIIAEIVGLDADPAMVRTAFEQGTSITAMVRLGRRRLTPRQVALARSTMESLTAPSLAVYATGDPRTVPGRLRELGMTAAQAQSLVAALVLTGTETLVSFLPRL